jgi:uncharacterized protein
MFVLEKIKFFLQKKDVNPSIRYYGIDVLGSMTYGLFSTLIIGLILSELGKAIQFQSLIDIGKIATSPNVVGGAIGVSVAYALKSPQLVLFSSIVTGCIGYQYSGVVGAFVSSLIGSELGKLVSKETKVDIIVTPIITILSGAFISYVTSTPINKSIYLLSQFLVSTTNSLPLIMGVVVGVVMGMALTLPISSAALSIMMGIDGVVAGAICAGCSAQMIGFSVSSYRENKVSGLMSQGIGTSMLQVPNIIKNPKIWIPPTISSGVCGGLATTIFQMKTVSTGAGMGTSGLVGQISTLSVMGYTQDVYVKIILLHFVIPAILSLLISEYMRKKGHIKLGDMQL